MKKWVRPEKKKFIDDIHLEHRKHIASVKEKIKKNLPEAAILPTTEKDKNDAKHQLALRISCPISTKLSIVGFFADDRSRFFATASEGRLIEQYKQEAQDSWVENHAEVMEDIRLSGRRWLPGNN
ncbi:hypothetical protein [Legionella sp. WA2022007384]